MYGLDEQKWKEAQKKFMEKLKTEPDLQNLPVARKAKLIVERKKKFFSCESPELKEFLISHNYSVIDSIPSPDNIVQNSSVQSSQNSSVQSLQTAPAPTAPAPTAPTAPTPATAATPATLPSLKHQNGMIQISAEHYNLLLQKISLVENELASIKSILSISTSQHPQHMQIPQIPQNTQQNQTTQNNDLDSKAYEKYLAYILPQYINGNLSQDEAIIEAKNEWQNMTPEDKKPFYPTN